MKYPKQLNRKIGKLLAFGMALLVMLIVTTGALAKPVDSTGLAGVVSSSSFGTPLPNAFDLGKSSCGGGNDWGNGDGDSGGGCTGGYGVPDGGSTLVMLGSALTVLGFAVRRSRMVIKP